MSGSDCGGRQYVRMALQGFILEALVGTANIQKRADIGRMRTSTIRRASAELKLLSHGSHVLQNETCACCICRCLGLTYSISIDAKVARSSGGRQNVGQVSQFRRELESLSPCTIARLISGLAPCPPHGLGLQP